MKHKPYIVIGHGSHASEIATLIHRCNREVFGYVETGKFELLNEMRESQIHFLFARGIGDPKVFHKVLKEFEVDYFLDSSNVESRCLIDPFSSLQSLIETRGVTVQAGSVISINCVIGDWVSINQSCSVSHDCVLGAFTTLAPHVTLCGKVIIGRGALIGAGATILPGITIGAWSVIGAGAVVTHDVPEGERWWGVPARLNGCGW